MNVALLTHPDCEAHGIEGHPERPERLSSVMNRLESSGMTADLDVRSASEVTDEDIVRAHPHRYLEAILDAAPATGAVRLDPDTYMIPGSLRAAKLAAGALTEATRLVLDGEVRQAFCATRPPGHHAELSAAMGFCIFNNIAIAAEVALAAPRINRVAILDFDVHHCNGTVDIFKDREEVLVCSSFQDSYYPYRYLDFSNHHIINSPLPAGSDGTRFRQAIETDWLPAIEAHQPDLVLVSAGFDAHRNDPLAQLNLIEDDYRWITRQIQEVAANHAGGRLVSTLEGGYDLDALASCVETHVGQLITG